MRAWVSFVTILAEEGYDPVVPEGASEEAVFAKMGQFMQKAHEWGERIPTGVLLENRAVSTFTRRNASYQEAPPARRPIADGEGRSVADLDSLSKEMMIGP
jgi:2-oxoglutarate ferredoxin oxidoreductase subunit beta